MNVQQPHCLGTSSRPFGTARSGPPLLATSLNAATPAVRCPGTPTCSGNGKCMSLREAASVIDGVSLRRHVRYDLWDADRIFGCACDSGFTGYDCSQRDCPAGVDPLAVLNDGVVPEIQQIVCTCNGVCDGYMHVLLHGAMSGPVFHNATASAADENRASAYGGTGLGESLRAKLGPLFSSQQVKSVTMASGKLCTAAGAITTITFNDGAGDVPTLEVDYAKTLTSDGLTKEDGGTVLVAVSTVQDSTGVAQPCSARGACDKSSGTCRCITDFAQSDGNGGFGAIGDCGYVAAPGALTECGSINGAVCSGHGTCSGAPSYRCSCVSGFTGGDCSLRECPMGRAWFDEATVDNMAHVMAICSNMGTCDFGTGNCVCRAGFSGAACDRKDCPKNIDGWTCNRRGRCLTLRELAPLGRVMGDFPGAGRNEVQQLHCTLTTGTFELGFRYSLTGPIPFSATAVELRDALEELASLNFVEVTLIPDNGQVCSAAGETARIEFTHDFGDLPLLQTFSPSVTVSEEQAGSRVSYGSIVSNPSTWDADQMRACHCDSYPDYNQTFETGDLGRYQGPMCEFRTCPSGTDPMGAVPIRYSVSCEADGGSMTLSFSGSTSSPLTPATTSSELVTLLDNMASVEGVFAVEFDGPALCSVPAATSQVWLKTRIEAHAVNDLDAQTASLTAGAGAATVTVTRVSSVLGNENQTIFCKADGGSFAVEFRGHKTGPIAVTADPAAVKKALESLPTIGQVSVTMGGVVPRTVCSSAGVSTIVTFDTQLGDLATMASDPVLLTLVAGVPTLTVSETDKGTTTVEVCSGRGFCGEPLLAARRPLFHLVRRAQTRLQPR